MDYNSLLKLVKQQHPEMPFKEQQKEASKKLAEFKEKQKQAIKVTPISEGTKPNAPDSEPEEEKGVTLVELQRAEKMIRSNTPDINSVISIGRQFIPKGHLIKKAKEGVNTLVSWEDEEGNKLPITGYFRIWI